MATVMRRTEKKRNASADTSSVVTRASSSRARGPAMAKPPRCAASGRTPTPRTGHRLSNHRM
jgi:hypothetical protein